MPSSSSLGRYLDTTLEGTESVPESAPMGRLRREYDPSLPPHFPLKPPFLFSFETLTVLTAPPFSPLSTCTEYRVITFHQGFQPIVRIQTTHRRHSAAKS